VKTIRIGAGAGFSGDRIGPAVELARDGRLDYLVFECLAERTIALAQLNKRQGRNLGFDPMLGERMKSVLPFCAANGTRIITNMGAANPKAAALETLSIARNLGLTGMRVAWIEGDDVLPQLSSHQSEDPREHVVSANAYLGIEPILDCLRGGADVIVTGRVADPSLFLAPMVYEFGWATDDWNRLGQGIAVGHLLECAAQLTGGYFADPGYKNVPDLERIGFPFADVDETGEALLSKLAGTGGSITISTCKEQILYEVHDPTQYLTPDVTADFGSIRFTQIGPDEIKVSGARGSERPLNLKVSVGFHAGFIAEAQISYAGPGALPRARLAKQVLERRLHWIDRNDLRLDFVGIDSMHGIELSRSECEPYEVRLRAAGRFFEERDARSLMHEVESLYVNGPAGGGGVAGSMRENIAMDAAFLPRTSVTTVFGMETA
jgi:Acyclic terpene utilisation family protein AtuA